MHSASAIFSESLLDGFTSWLLLFEDQLALKSRFVDHKLLLRRLYLLFQLSVWLRKAVIWKAHQMLKSCQILKHYQRLWLLWPSLQSSISVKKVPSLYWHAIMSVLYEVAIQMQFGRYEQKMMYVMIWLLTIFLKGKYWESSILVLRSYLCFRFEVV